jgi:hypothetical protein
MREIGFDFGCEPARKSTQNLSLETKEQVGVGGVKKEGGQ